MQNIMIDLETLGLSADAAIVSIGAVKFDESGIDPNEFYVNVSIQSNLDYGRKIDGSTLTWWFGQDQAARDALLKPAPWHLREALASLSFWIHKGDLDTIPQYVVWGNGAAFDPVLLESAFKQVFIPVPWRFYNVRCFRTLKNLVQAPEDSFVGTKHNALDDARNQARRAITLLKVLSQCQESAST